LLFNVHSFFVFEVVFFGNGNFFTKSRFSCQGVKIGRKVLIFEVFRLAGKVTVAKTRQSMPAGRVAMSIGTSPASAGKVTMAKTEQSTVVGKLTASAGRLTAFTGKLTLAVGHGDDVRREVASKRRATCHCHRWHAHSRLTRGARWFECVAVVFHRTHEERWIESVATGQKDFPKKIIHGA
jgi:hypothetical protein